MSNKPSILFTNLFELTRTGSELHVLALAEAFKQRGWDVDVFCLVKGLPLQQAFLEKGIRLFDYAQIDELKPHYDVFFAQHQLAAESVWRKGITFEKIVVSSLSPYSEHEELPSFAGLADLLVVNSEETLDVREAELHRLAHNTKNISKQSINLQTTVFLNYASESAFEFGKAQANADDSGQNYPTQATNAESDWVIAEQQSRNRQPNGSSLSRIAVISNHVPAEIHQAVPLFEAAGISCDLFGYENISVDITPEFLGSYDLVVSIGQTAQMCFATKTPLYCYDNFGGPGYLDVSSLDAAEHFNYSGRHAPVKRTAEELFDDVVAGYAVNSKNLDVFYERALDHYAFEKLFDSFYKKLEDIKPQERSCPQSSSAEGPMPNATLLKLSIDGFLASINPLMGTMQLFYDDSFEGGVPAEEKSLALRYRYNTSFDLHPKLFFPADASASYLLRLDPDLKPVACKADKNMEPFRPFDRKGDEDYFVSNDPILLVKDRAATESLRFWARDLTDDALISYLEKSAEILGNYSGSYSATLENIEEFKKSSLLKKVRLLFNRFIKHRLRRPKAS